jgi:hypothetical protein
MAYARWSSMNHSCDIYLYADAGGGYTCHVAKSRRVSDVPCPELPQKFWERPVDEVSALLKAQQAWVQTTTLEPIGLPHDGRSFYNYHRDEMVEILKMLKEAGYRMPEDLIDVIASEEDEAK